MHAAELPLKRRRGVQVSASQKNIAMPIPATAMPLEIAINIRSVATSPGTLASYAASP